MKFRSNKNAIRYESKCSKSQGFENVTHVASIGIQEAPSLLSLAALRGIRTLSFSAESGNRLSIRIRRRHGHGTPQQIMETEKFVFVSQSGVGVMVKGFTSFYHCQSDSEKIMIDLAI